MSGIHAPGIIALSIFKPSDGTVHLLPGQRMSPGSQVQAENATRTTARGAQRRYGIRWTGEIGFDDPDLFDDLRADEGSGSDWQARVVGFEQTLFFDRAFSFQAQERVEGDPQSDEYPYLLRFAGFDPRTKRDIMDHINLFGGDFNILTDDSGDILTDDGDILTDGEPEVLFPVPGAVVTLSSEVVDPPTTIAFTARDFSGSALESVSESFDSTGRKSVQMDLPADTWKLTDFEFGDYPALRLSDKTQYVEY